MKKFSRMPKSESGGLGGASGTSSSSGVSSYFGKVFAVGRYQVTVEELVAEGMFSFSGSHPPYLCEDSPPQKWIRCVFNWFTLPSKAVLFPPKRPFVSQ